ncbi:MAG: hypothetical protein JWR16_1623 [Nevskia sp.]|nr:hypothetical protein [Nevskia sp.]
MKSNGSTLESAARRVRRAVSKEDPGFGAALSGELRDFLSDIEDLVKATASLTGGELDRAKEKLQERVTAAKESLDELSSEVSERAVKTAKATDAYVHEQPWQAIGVGAGAGFLLGYLVARR